MYPQYAQANWHALADNRSNGWPPVKLEHSAFMVPTAAPGARAASSLHTVKVERTAQSRVKTEPGLHVAPQVKPERKIKTEIKAERPSINAEPRPLLASHQRAGKVEDVPIHDPTQPYQTSVLAHVPTEIWTIIFQDVLSMSLGQLLLCAAVCRDWRHLVLNNVEIDRLLAPFASTLGNVQATPARGKKTPARTLGENLARAYGKMCEWCGLKGKNNKVGLWRESNGILCLHCRVIWLTLHHHPGRPLVHHRGDTVPCSDCKRMGIPERYVKERMRVVATCANPYAPTSYPMKLYSVEEACRASYAATQSLEPIHLDSQEFGKLVHLPAKRGASGRRRGGSGYQDDWDYA